MKREDIEKVVDEYDVYTYHLDTVKICVQLVNQALEEAAQTAVDYGDEDYDGEVPLSLSVNQFMSKYGTDNLPKAIRSLKIPV